MGANSRNGAFFDRVARHRKWTIATAVAVALSVTPVARGQNALPDDDGALAGADAGFAPGEVPSRTVPYEPPATQPATQPGAALAPSDWYGQWKSWKSQLEQKTGTSFELYINPSAQYVVTGPGDGIGRGVIWYNCHVAQKLWEGGQILMNTRGGHGDGVNRYVDSLFNFNQHAGEVNCIYISHLMLDQKLFNDKVEVNIGKLDLLDFFDTNEVDDWNIIPYSLARNPSIPAPYHVLGARGRVDPCEWLYLQAGIADAGGRASETGFNTAFDDDEPYFSIGEVGFKPKFLDRPGTYRFMVWHNSGDIAHFDGSGTKGGDTGFALSFDQQVSDRLGLSLRYGWSDPEVRRINHYISVGMSLNEPLPGRNHDVLGASLAEILVSDDYRDSNPGIESTATQVDLYYKIEMAPWITVTPDVQVILNPDQDTSKDFAVIAGVYVEMRF